MPSRWCDETVSHCKRDRTLVMVRMRDRAVRAASIRAGSLCTLLLFLALMPIIRVDGGEWGDADDPLRLQARSLIASVRSFLGGSCLPMPVTWLRPASATKGLGLRCCRWGLNVVDGGGTWLARRARS